VSHPIPERATTQIEDRPLAASAKAASVAQRSELVLLLFSGLFLGTVAMLNLLGLTRFPVLGSVAKWPIVVAMGALPCPVTFLCTDLISKLWGE